MSSIAPAPQESFIKIRLPFSVCNSPRPRARTASLTPSAARFVRGCSYMHLVRHHWPERRFVCSGTNQLRAVMALHQCDLFRGGRPADYLARSAEPITCSVGPLSCTCRLRVDREYRVLLIASGPRFVRKDIGTGAVAARRVGNVFCDRGFADVFLRHLMQTGGRMHMPMNRLQCDIQLQGCKLGHLLPEHTKTMWPVAEDIVRSPDVSAWRTALRTASTC